ncbi:VOC family protein [Haloarcula sp. JP-L23]|uniref:VOC family protein n=1 Tax=Haloarcula sp. JP-L23 TaxID=2716717 RepID=UPI00140F3506|nr:VOC family protein [Haloarcula sp. JP-L23]
MSAFEINHVSVHADDLEESVTFYEDVFGMERVPSPNFEAPVEWLACGEQQLHLFDRDVEAPAYHHFGMTVENFEAVFEAARERDLFANWDDSGDPGVYSLPDGAVQVYLNDPAGNLIEVNHPDVDALDESVRQYIVPRSEQFDQSGEAAEATIGLPKRAD